MTTAAAEPLRRIALVQPGWLHGDGTGAAAAAVLAHRHPGIEFRRGASGPAGDVDPDVLADADAVVCLDLPGDILRQAPKVRWIQTVSAGVDGLPVQQLLDAGVRVSQASGTAAPEIAEFVMARILEHDKRLPTIAERAARHSWEPIYGVGLTGRRIGLLGFGSINRRVATLANAFGMEVSACSRTLRSPEEAGVRRTFGLDALADMLADSDVLVCAVPATPETEALLDAAAFAALSPGAYVVNVGRGSVLDVAALVAAIDAGHLAGAALDVFEHEPLPADDPVWDHPLIRVSAHCSAVPHASIERVMDLVSTNIVHFLAGRPLANEL